MKKLLFCILLLCCISTPHAGIAQSQRPAKHNHPSGKMNAVSTGVNLPLGDFSAAHVVGIVSEYSWSNHRFGRMDVKPVKPIGFISNAGVAYYFGKKETAGGYPYDYPGYLFLHVYGGVIYNPWKKGNVNLTLGPALGLYNGNNRFNIGGKLEGCFYIKEKIGICPSLLVMKEQAVDALWAISLKAAYCF